MHFAGFGRFFGHRERGEDTERDSREFREREVRQRNGNYATKILHNVSAAINRTRPPLPKKTTDTGTPRAGVSPSLESAEEGNSLNPEDIATAYIALEFRSEADAAKCLSFIAAEYPAQRTHVPSPDTIIVRRDFMEKEKLKLFLKAQPNGPIMTPVRLGRNPSAQNSVAPGRPGIRPSSPLRTKEGLLAALRELEAPLKK
jgi:hypothetical protein